MNLFKAGSVDPGTYKNSVNSGFLLSSTLNVRFKIDLTFAK